MGAGMADENVGADRVAYRERADVPTQAAPVGVHDALGKHEDTLQSSASSIEQLDAVVTELEGRLAPVLNPNVPPSPEDSMKRSPDVGTPDRAERSPLAERVELLTSQVRTQRRDTQNLSGRVRALLERLEV